MNTPQLPISQTSSGFPAVLNIKNETCTSIVELLKKYWWVLILLVIAFMYYKNMKKQTNNDDND
jgi:hypothetical protein